MNPAPSKKFVFHKLLFRRCSDNAIMKVLNKTEYREGAG